MALEVFALPATVPKFGPARAAGSPWPSRIVWACGAAVALLGIGVLLGWAIENGAVKSVLPGLVEMKANTAFGFLLAGVALAIAATPACKSHRSVVVAGGASIIAIGVATLFEYLVGPDLGIDSLLFADAAGTGSVRWGLPPGRMALTAAAAFVSTGISLIFLFGRATAVSQLLAFATALLAVFSLAAYLCQEVGITGESAYTSMALHTSAGFTLLAVGLLAAAPARGPVAVLRSATRSGAVARILLPVALGVTLGLGGLGAACERAGWFGPVFGTLLFSITNAAVLAGVILYVVHRALLSELAAGQSGDQVHRLNAALEQRVVERTAELEAVTVSLRLQIEERRIAEEALSHARGQLLDTIESLDAGLIMYGPDQKIVVCNAKCRELYPQTAEAMVPGTAFEDLQRAFYRSGALAESGRTEEQWVEFRQIGYRNPGQPIEQWLSGRWIRHSDRRTSAGGMVSLRTDITVLKKAQEAAEFANRAKSEFLANMSHEIRTPMNGILGMTELTLDTDLTGVQRKNLGMVKVSADSLLQIVNDILDFSKIEAGKMELDPIPFTLRDCLANAVEAQGQRAREKGLELNCRIGADVPETLVGDALRLRQILTNLVGNAIKFTSSGSIIVGVQGAECRLQSGEKDGISARHHPLYTLHFSIEDTGIGIPAEQQKSIFEAFTQADASTTRRFGGTGLGLAIASQLVDLMGGCIWLESGVGRGSTFHFTAQFEVPAGPISNGSAHPNDTEQQQQQQQHQRSTGRGGAGPAEGERSLRVLLAEDNEVNRELAIQLLQKRGHTVLVAVNGREAVEALERKTADVVLMDVQMPEMDGFAATAAIREREAATGVGRIPIVALTAHAMKGDRERCLAAGMDAYIAKPLRVAELFATIGRLVPGGDTAGNTPPSPLGQIEEFPPVGAFDEAAALARVEGDRNLLRKMIGLFAKQAQKLLPEIRRAGERGDGLALERLAHKLSGSMGSFGAGRASRAALSLEVMGRNGDYSRIGEALADLECEVALLREALAAFAEDGALCLT